MTIATIIILLLFILAPTLLTLTRRWILGGRGRRIAPDQQPPPDEPLSKEEIEEALRSVAYQAARAAQAPRPEESPEKWAAVTETARPKPMTAKSAGAFCRLQALSPLKRAVVWAEILGPPGGREPPV